ncbi:UvrB/UvrC motif-containing protein [Streptomyces sp. NPDC051642]|uniref:UvrB/UvrC motif-containing protein n=1 Tax=Streptomyces sp. NPDC051642 TaxID=3154646 RepID=UPI0034367738
MEQLARDKDQAAADEDHEKATQLRDRIAGLKVRPAEAGDEGQGDEGQNLEVTGSG